MDELEETTDHPIVPWLTAPRRRWLYSVLTAVQPLLIAYGVASDSDAPLIVGLALAIVGTGTAAAHTAR